MKKGAAIGMIVAIILATAFVVVSLVVLSGFKQAPGIDQVTDDLCTQRINLLSTKASSAVGIDIPHIGRVGLSASQVEALTNYFTVHLFEFQKQCKTRMVQIDPNDWSKCDQKFEMAATSSKEAAEKNCAMQQVAELVRRCWSINGEGELDAYNWACFATVIGETDLGKEDMREKVRASVNNLFKCDSDSANADCPKLAKEVFESEAKSIAIYNGYINFLTSSTKNNMAICADSEAQIEGKKILVENPFSDSLMINWDAIDLWFISLHSEVQENEEVNQEKLEKNIDEEKGDDNFCKIDNYFEEDENGDDVEFSGLKEQFNETLGLIISAENEREGYYNTLSEKFCESRAPGYGCELIPNVLEDISEELGGASEVDRISEEEFHEFINNNQVLNMEAFYNDFIDTDKIEFESNTPIIGKETFQVVYCDGVLPVFSGFAAQGICGPGKKILISNTLTAGGADLAAADLAASCPLTENTIGLIDTQITNKITEVCQQITF